MKRRLITILGLMFTVIMMSAMFCSVFALESIDKVEFSGFKPAEYGAKADCYSLMTKDGHSYMDGSFAGWYKLDGEGGRQFVSASSTFDEGDYIYFFRVQTMKTDGYEFADPTEIYMNGESWGTFTPSTQGDLSYQYVDSPVYTIGHNYVYDHTDPATADDAGKRWEKCDRCGDMRYDEIAAIGSIDCPAAVYDGTAKTPAITVYDAAEEVIPEDSYTVEMPENMVNAGVYQIKLSFNGNYSGVINVDFSIDKAPIDLSVIKWDYSKALPYSGSVKTVALSAEPEFARVEVAGNVGTKVGSYTATATVTPVDEANYEVIGEIPSLTWKIVPAKAAVAKTTPGTKKLTVKMSKKAAAYGAGSFQIAYKVKGTSKWKYTTTTSQSKAIKKLKSGKAYNVKVRALKTVDGKKYYGAWSKVYTSKKVK